jgi:hypothetical protein
MVHVAGKITGTERVNLGKPAKELSYQLNFSRAIVQECVGWNFRIYIHFVDCTTLKECAGVAQPGEADKKFDLANRIPAERSVMAGWPRASEKLNLSLGTAQKVLNQAGVAQLVEQLICNQPVAGSTPVASSICISKL